MARDYLPVMLEVEGFPDELLQWNASRFEALNGRRVHIVKSADLPPPARAVHSQCVFAWLWDIVPANTERLAFISHTLVPLRALPDLPDASFAAVECASDYLKSVASIYPLIHDTQKFFSVRFFVARRDTRELFDRLKAFATNKEVEDPHGDYLQTIFNLIVQSNMETVWLSRNCNVNIATDSIESLGDACIANLCALAPAQMFMFMNVLRTALGLNAYEPRE